MDKIAEIAKIVCPKCMYNGRECGAGYATTEDCPQVKDIQSLISERESALRSENEQLKADLLKEIQQGKAMAEALQDARWLIDMARNNEQADIYGESDDKILAKIDAALEGGGK